MLKRKLLKKSAVLFLATTMGISMMTGQVEAKSNILNDIIGAILTPSGSSSSSRPKTNDFTPSAKRVTLPLDGTYSSIYFPGGIFDKTGIVAEHYFELDRPAEVDLHFIGHVNRLFEHFVFDSDSNDLGGYVDNHDNATDRNIVLRPGRYVVKTKIYSGSSEKSVEFEVKGIKHDIYTTVTSEGYRRYDANVLYYNTEVVDYFPYATANEPNTKYYKFVLQSPMEIKLMMDKLSKSCDLVIYLLDEDESEIDSWYGIYDNHFEKVKYLNAGTYYLKIKRNSKKGAAYSIRIK